MVMIIFGFSAQEELFLKEIEHIVSTGTIRKDKTKDKEEEEQEEEEKEQKIIGHIHKYVGLFTGLHHSYCHLCGEGGESLCCESCNCVYHEDCLVSLEGWVK